MTPLARLIREHIANSGPISVAQYMATALGHPGLGYYTRGETAGGQLLGRHGDFVTAPEISQVFGELLAAWCADAWRAMGAPRPVILAELGPGRGTMLADLWRAACTVAPDLAEALRLHLIETSLMLRTRQGEALAALSPPPPRCWHARLDELPPGPLLLLANEFLDALPIAQYIFSGGLWRERLVSLSADGDGFAFTLGGAVDPALRPDLAELPAAAEGSLIERCPEAERLVAAVAGRLVGDGGAALFMDYGPARSGIGETLQAVRAHRPAHPLAEPGDVDLSHHVDFERLGQAAAAAGGQPWGPIPQGLFLSRLGIGERAQQLAAASPRMAETIHSAVRRLVHPGRMGLLFKAFAITDPALPAPAGFAAKG